VGIRVSKFMGWINMADLNTSTEKKGRKNLSGGLRFEHAGTTSKI
jgi:hypothetical protein